MQCGFCLSDIGESGCEDGNHYPVSVPFREEGGGPGARAKCEIPERWAGGDHVDDEKDGWHKSPPVKQGIWKKAAARCRSAEERRMLGENQTRQARRRYPVQLDMLHLQGAAPSGQMYEIWRTYEGQGAVVVERSKRQRDRCLRSGQCAEDENKIPSKVGPLGNPPEALLQLQLQLQLQLAHRAPRLEGSNASRHGAEPGPSAETKPELSERRMPRQSGLSDALPGAACPARASTLPYHVLRSACPAFAVQLFVTAASSHLPIC